MDFVNYISGGYFFQEKPIGSGEELLDELKKYPEAIDLLNEAEEAAKRCGLPPLEFRLEATKSGFAAEQDGHILRIRPGDTASRQLGNALFELTNLIQKKEHDEANFLVTTCAAEEYTRAKEYVEYKGLLKCVDVVNKINSNHGGYFKSKINFVWTLYPIKTVGFNIYYYFMLDNSHKNYYRSYWNEVNKTTGVAEGWKVKNLVNDAFKTAAHIAGNLRSLIKVPSFSSQWAFQERQAS